MELRATKTTTTSTRQIRAQGGANELKPIIEAIDYNIKHCMALYCVEIVGGKICIEANNNQTTIFIKGKSATYTRGLLDAFELMGAYMK